MDAEFRLCTGDREETDHELMRPQWKQLMNALDRGDELVVSKFSNAVRGVRELAVCIEMCRIKVVRLISIHDRIDSRNELFKETTAAEVLEMVGALPEEIAALRKSSSHIMMFQKNIKSPAKTEKLYPGLNGKGPSWTCITTAIPSTTLPA